MQPDCLTPALGGVRKRSMAGKRRAAAAFVWWASGVVCSVFLGAPLLPSLSVLSQLPFREVGDDLQALFTHFTTHPATGTLIQSLLLTWVLGRLVLSVPLTWFIANLDSRAMPWPRLVLRVLRRLPAVLGLCVVGQVALVLLFGTSAPYLLGRLAVASTPFDFALTSVMLLTVMALASAGLALHDVSRVAAIYGRGHRVLSTALLDGLTLLVRKPWRVLLYTAGTWAGALVVGLIFGAAAFTCAGHAPESWGQVSAWLLLQLGVVSGLGVRAVGWSKLIAEVTAAPHHHLELPLKPSEPL
jgi:hypothetical protein